jgi:hypothetical protein
MALLGTVYGGEPAGGGATIGTPVITVPAAQAVDPFAKSGVMPTPIVPYASKGTDLDPMTRPAAMQPPVAAEISPAAPTPSSSSIGAGDLVPVAIPTTSEPPPKPAKRKIAKPVADKKEQPSAKAKASDDEKTGEADKTNVVGKPNEAAKPAGEMSTIMRPAILTRDVTTPSTVEPAAPVGAAPVSTPPLRTSPGAAPRPVNFSFPQPVIPLESMLRQLLKLTGDRR